MRLVIRSRWLWEDPGVFLVIAPRWSRTPRAYRLIPFPKARGHKAKIR